MSDLESIVGAPVELPQEAPQPQPAEESAAAEESTPQQEDPQKDGGQQSDSRVVPLAALHEERSKRRELAAQVEAERRTREEMERRFEARLQAIARSATPQKQVPSLEENPVGHLSHKLDVMQSQQQALMQQSQAEREAAQLAEYESALAAKVQHEERVFAATHPDYVDAVKHLHAVRLRELNALGVDDAQAEMQSARELRELAYVTSAKGQSPAEIAYKFAQARGYVGKQPDAAQRIQTAQRGAAAATSLGNGASTGSGAMGARELLAMSDEEFAKATSGDKWRKLMGAS